MPISRHRQHDAPDTAPARLAELADLIGGESPRSRRFLGGLVMGALAGAALAGTALLGRRSGPRRAVPPRDSPTAPRRRRR